jgi:uncharacterized protein YukJ
MTENKINPQLNYHVLKSQVIGMTSEMFHNTYTHLLLLMRYEQSQIKESSWLSFLQFNNTPKYGFSEIAINENSKLEPHEVQFFYSDDFMSIDANKVNAMKSLNFGYTKLDDSEDTLKKLGFDLTEYNLDWKISKNNDILDILRNNFITTINNIEVNYDVYIFGTKFQNVGQANNNFGFNNDNGIHNCHMNQLNGGKFAFENGWRQDGAMIIHDKTNDKWSCLFIKFQSQK